MASITISCYRNVCWKRRDSAIEATAFRCPTCGSRALQPNPDGTLTCTRCGTVCEPAIRACPDCGAVNPPEAEWCCACGRPLDLVGFVLRARLGATSERLEQARQQAAVLKREAEAASQERLRGWWEQEAERRRALARKQEERDRQERMLLTAAAVFAVIVLVAILIYVLAVSGGPGVPAVTPTPLP